MPHEYSNEQSAARATSGTHLAETCLPALIPATTARIHCHDEDTAARLEDADARIKPAAGITEVEIGALSEVSRKADCVVLVLGPPVERLDRWRGRLMRLVSRLAVHGRLKLVVWFSVARLRHRGYPHVEALLWDKGSPLRVSGRQRFRLTVGDRLPRHAVVCGARRRPQRTALQQALDEAEHAAGRSLSPYLPLPKSGVIVAVAEHHVVRVAIGPGWHRIRQQAHAVNQLTSSRLSGDARRLLPRELAASSTGLARWSLETRVPGTPAPPGPVGAQLRDDCLSFLLELFPSRAQLVPASSLVADAGAVASVLDDDAGDALREVASRASMRLSGLPHGVTHGDFFHGNLLVRGGRLSGVVDWDSARSDDFPLLDLFHLEATGRGRKGSLNWGPTIVNRLLPEARAGGSSLARTYCARLLLPPEPELLEALVIAYWIRRLCYQVHGYANRVERPIWVQRNVREVLRSAEV